MALMALAVLGAVVWWVAQPERARLAPSLASSAALAGPVAAASVASVASAAAAPAAPAASEPVAVPANGPTALASNDESALLQAAHANPATAWRELALHWNVAIGEGDACAVVAQARLACFRSANGGLAVARQLGRPGLISLHQAQGAPVYALLVGVNATQATLQAGDARFDLTLPALARVWRGDFATYWRIPRGWRDGGGMAPQARTWIDQQLSAAGYAGPQPLADRVRAFQLAQGLPTDGLAGAMTLMRLNRAAGIDEPRLQGE
jgi:general secretion pathway protein A